MESRNGTKRILVVDDSKNILQTLKNLLEVKGYRCEGASTGIDALCAIVKERPDCIFMDKDCSDLDGFQLCALLKEKEEYRDIPFILMTDREDAFDNAKATVLGAKQMLCKPFGNAELMSSLELADVRAT